MKIALDNITKQLSNSYQSYACLIKQVHDQIINE